MSDVDIGGAWRNALADIVSGDRFAQADELPAVASAALAPMGVDMVIRLVDQEQRSLRPVSPRPVSPEPLEAAGRKSAPVLPIDETPAGRAFMYVQAVSSPGDVGQAARLWMPLLDGNERLGVLELIARDPAVDLDHPEFRSGCDLFAQMTGHLIAAKIPYGDTLGGARRTRRMSEASELVWRLLPPLTFASRRVVLSGILEPCYEVGGDAFDYAVDGSTAFFAVFDTAGHDLRSGLGTATVMSAIRAARADGAGLSRMVLAADDALARYLPELRFTTAVLGTLDLDTGLLRYVNAGHPAPMLLRGGEVVARLDRGRRLPLGLDGPAAEVAELQIQPEDRLLLFTDGVTEACRDGRPFGEERLGALVARHTAAGLPAPETLRRICHAALEYAGGPPADDVTLLFVEWSETAPRRMVP